MAVLAQGFSKIYYYARKIPWLVWYFLQITQSQRLIFDMYINRISGILIVTGIKRVL